MKNIWVPLFVLLQLPAAHSEQRPAQPLENARSPYEDSIRNQTQEQVEKSLFDSGLTFEVPPLGSWVLRSSGTEDIRRGWIRVRTGTDSVSGLLTYREGTTGIEVSVESAELVGRFALFVEESADVGA